MKRHNFVNALLIIFFSWHSLAMAAVSVQVNPSTVHLGEAFRLTFTIDAPPANTVLDLSPLQENFTIVGTERSTAYSIINGQTHSIAQWIVLLTAKKTGTLTIPSLQIGRQNSPPVTINIIDSGTTVSPDEQKTTENEIMIKAAVSTQSPFISQQVIYTVKLYNSLRLMDGEYVPPRAENALLVPLGDGHRYEEVLDGRHFIVEEQQYVVFPQKSGELNILSPAFNALVFDTVPRRINVQDKPIKLSVKPMPATYSGKDWLPAKQVALTEVYDQNVTQVKEGSTLVRTVTLQAAGVPGQLLPHLNFASNSQFNVYTEKPELRNMARQQELIGRADVKATYVFNKPGRVTIPAITITWFNTVTDKEETASLPARVIEVIAAAIPGPPSVTTPSIVEPVPNTILEKKATLAWWIAALFALAWIVTLLLWIFLRKKPIGRKISQHQLLEQIEKACRDDKPQEAREALLRWASARWPEDDVLNLQQLGLLTQDEALKKQLLALSQELYSPKTKVKWQGKALWLSLRSYLKVKHKAKNKPKDLPPINPSLRSG
jgi:hypothetical protein